MENKVQLITYVDRFGCGDIQGLHKFLKNELSDIVEGGVHLLPFFYPIDGSDAGYDPVDNRVVDNRIGTWNQVKELALDFPIMTDLIVNHISEDSNEFKDVLDKGSKSAYFDLFLTKEKIYGNEATESSINKIYRPRPNRPFSLRKLANGEQAEFWTTFSHSQIDIDVKSKQGLSYVHSILDTFAENGINTIRLDAVGYAIKKFESSCFMIPETYEFIEEMVEVSHEKGIEVLVEIHSHHKTQIKVAKYADYVYDFALPPLILYSIASGNFKSLKKWLAISPKNCVTVLDTHDGIGIIDVAADAENEGLLNEDEMNTLVESIHKNSGNTSKKATGLAASNLDLYQVNCTFFEALGKNEFKYLVARAIQFFSPGIPQVYYSGLLAMENDMELLEKTKVGRDINRPYLSFEEIKKSMGEPVVKDFFELIRFRNTHSSFSGNFELLETKEGILKIKWENEVHFSILEINHNMSSLLVEYTDENLELKRISHGREYAT